MAGRRACLPSCRPSRPAIEREGETPTLRRKLPLAPPGFAHEAGGLDPVKYDGRRAPGASARTREYLSRGQRFPGPEQPLQYSRRESAAKARPRLAHGLWPGHLDGFGRLSQVAEVENHSSMRRAPHRDIHPQKMIARGKVRPAASGGRCRECFAVRPGIVALRAASCARQAGGIGGQVESVDLKETGDERKPVQRGANHRVLREHETGAKTEKGELS